MFKIEMHMIMLCTIDQMATDLTETHGIDATKIKNANYIKDYWKPLNSAAIK